MELKEMMIEELEARKLEIKEAINQPEADLDALEEEARAINEELETRAKAEAEKVEKRKEVAEGNETKEIEKLEERKEGKTMTEKEIRSSQEYIDAYAKYLKTGRADECRALLTELVAPTGGVPVPSFVEDEIMTAWESDEILRRVSKSYIRGILRVGFEQSATGASIHTEGEEAPAEEELALGVVSLTPYSIKKWITISDEAIDMGSEAFIRYIYNEIAHQIAKVAGDEVIGAIATSPATSTATAPAVAEISKSALDLTTIVEAIAQLKGDVRDLAILMNRGTYASFRALQANANFAMDIFEGLPIIFTDGLKNFSEASTADPVIIVGDLGKVRANFPNGQNDITFKYDDLSLAEADLVKIVGRMYVGIGVVAPYAFCKVVKGE